MGIDLNKDFFGSVKTKTRKPFPKTIKDAVLQLQDDKCKKCGKKFTSINKAQFDHKNGKNWDNTLRNCQALHAGCHDAKSRSATKKRATTKKKTKSGSKPVKVGDFIF
jgi:5-methylcytosine-specific restriction endonuclease McrA